MSKHQLRNTDNDTLERTVSAPEGLRRVEVITGVGRRRRWSREAKARIVLESQQPGAVVSEVARQHGMTPQQLFGWRREARNGVASGDAHDSRRSVSTAFAPIVVAEAGSGAEGGEGNVVIAPGNSVQVLVATKPVDFRKGADGLAALVQESLSSDPFCGAIYVFRAKRANRVKLLCWDGTGICLFAKRLEEGHFRWPRIADGVMHLSAAQLSALLEGLDFARVYPRDVARPSATQ